MPRRSRPLPSSAGTGGSPWRTAPGIGSDGAAAPVSAPELPRPSPPHAADLGRSPSPFPASPGDRARLNGGEKPSVATDPPAPPPLFREARASTGVHEELRELDDTAQRATTERGSDQDCAAAAPSASTDARTESPETAELAHPQIPLNADLPRTSTHQAGQASGTRAVARRSAGEEFLSRSVRSLEPISDLEAASFAGRFATDFQSFDEDDPNRRAEVLRPLLADPQACTWGWSGAGRQRADSPLPGRIYRPSDTVVFVEVIVRVTTYARACPPPETPRPVAAAEVELSGLLGPSCAPPEADPAWAAAEANWVRMTVPITRDDDGHLVVDPHLRPTDPS